MNKAQVYSTKILKALAIAGLAVFALSFVLSWEAQASAGINKTINFQGKVVNKTAGTNVSDNTYTMIFKIYDKPSGGTQLWTETDSVAVTDGIFRVALGSTTPFPAGMNWNQDGLFLDITFNSEAMGSRVQLTAVPYAFNAGQVAGLTVQDSTSGAASTSATLKLGDATTPKTFDLGTNSLSFTTSGTTTLALPTSGTVTALGNTTTGSGTTLVLASNPSLAGLTLTSGGISLGGTVSDSSHCIVGGATAAWGSCGSGGTNYWNLGAGFITPVNSTADLLIGGQSTASAKFTVTNLAGNNLVPIASISGNLIVYPDAGNKGGNLGVGVANPQARLDVGINDLQNETIQVKSKLTAGLEIIGDSDNGAASGGENGGAYANFSIDGGTNTGNIGVTQQNGLDAKGNTFTGGSANSFIINAIGTTGANGLQLGIGNKARLTFRSDGTAVFGAGNSTPNANFDIRPQIGTLAVASISGNVPFANLVVDSGNATGDIFTASNSGVPKFTIASNGTVTLHGTTITAGNLSTFTTAPSLALTATTLTLGNGSAATLKTTTNGLTLDSGSNTLTIDSSDTTITASGLATLTTASTLAISATTTKFGTNPGTTGAIGIPNNTYITARNAANNADINLIKIDASNLVAFGANTAAFTLGGAITGNSQNITGVNSLSSTSLTITGSLTANGSTGSGLCLTGGATASWGSCGSGGGTNYWNLNAGGNTGTITPINSTADLLIGSQATTSAKFAVLNLNSGTPTATIAGNLITMPWTNGANQTGGLVGIGTATPSYLLDINNASGFNGSRIVNLTQSNSNSNVGNAYGIYLNDTRNLGTLAAYNTDYGNYETYAPTGTITGGLGFDHVGYNSAQNLNGLTLSGASNFNGTNNYGASFSLSGSPTINETSGSSGALISNYGIRTSLILSPVLTSIRPGTTINQYGGDFNAAVTSAGNSNLATTVYGVNVTSSGNISTTGTTTHYGGKIAVSGTANNNYGLYVDASGATNNFAAIFNTGLVGIGTATPNSELYVTRALSQGATGKALAILDQIENQDIFTASKAGVTKFTLDQNGNASQSGSLVMAGANSIQTTAFNTLTLGGSTTGNIVIAPWNGAANSTLSIQASNTFLGIAGSMNGKISFYSSGAGITPPTISTDSSGNLNLAATQAGASVIVGSGTGNIVIDPNTSLIGVGTSSPVSMFHLTRSLSNGATGKALAIFDQIENQDIFTASKGGTTKFVLDQNGLGTFAGGLTLSSGAITLGGSTGSGLCINGGATATWGSCGSGGGTNYFGQSNGLTFIGNTTTDFAIGGNSTGSADFVFGGMNGNGATPTATFSGDLIINNRPSTASTDMQKWTKITGTAGTIGGNNSSIASISASVVFNGSLYVGTNKSGAAEVYRYDGDGPGTWTKVSQTTAGTIAASGTSAIDMVSAMTVYNGYLYIGTSKSNAAEVYRYDGGTTWTKVSGTAGTFQTTTLIDGVSSMAVFGGRLFIGTKESDKAEIYMYNGGTSWIVTNGTAGTFVATNTVSVDAVTQMVVWNNTLIVGTMNNTGDADVLRWNGIVGGSNYFALNLASTTGSYLIDNAAQTGYNESASMVVWAGKLIVALRRGAGQADVLMYQEPPGGAAPINSWTRLNSAAGTIVSGGTASIDSVTSMAVYDGRLYIGTSKANSAEIYRYDQDKNWVKVSQNTAGMIASGGTGSIDAISVLIPYNHNSLFAGTQEGTTAEGYTYNVAIDQSYALKFNSGASTDGGVQNNNQNYGAIYFVASLSANLNNKQGNTGTFVFDHSIMSTNGSYDVAEDYPTRDDTLEPGDVVSLDTNERGFIVKSNGAYDYTAIGVYSEKPGLRLSQDDSSLNGGTPIPVALVGRVPIKVSTENGVIKQGDPLTPSSTPGVAMKAKKSGLIIAEAMEPYDGDGIGKITAYVKSTSYDGSIANSFENIDVNSSTFGQDVLNQLATQEPSSGTSEIVTDRLVASIEMVSPRITVDELFAKKIVAGQIDGLDVAQINNRLSSLESKVATMSAGLGTPSVSSESALLAKQNELIDKITKDLNSNSSGPTASQGAMSLGSLDSSGLTVISNGIRVKGNGLFEGIVTVLDTLTTNNFIVNGASTFFSDVLFKGNVSFEKTPTFSSDTGGFATITQGTDRVSVKFDNVFENDPVVNAQVSFDEQKDDQGKVIDSTTLEQTYFKQGYKYIIVNRSKTGFTIVLNKKAGDDVNFTWTALQVKDAKSIQSRLPE